MDNYSTTLRLIYLLYMNETCVEKQGQGGGAGIVADGSYVYCEYPNK